MADGGLFVFAGLWERWEGPEQTTESCSIIVTDANDLIQPIHDRMPVVLDPADYDIWLDPKGHDPGILMPLLRRNPAERMEAYQVSRRVNSPANDYPECLEQP